MGRVEKKMYRRVRGQAILRRILLFCTALIVLAGLATRRGGAGSLQAETLPQPTATPVTAAFDETVETREVALCQETWYAIQTGIFSTDAAAEEKAGAYADRGAPGIVVQDGAKYRVLIAAYGRKDDAAEVRARLTEKQNVDTYLHEWACPAITLRLTGMAGQLDVAEAGLTLIPQTAAALRDQATLLDAGELTVAEVRQRNASLGEQITLWAKTARERFAKPYPDLVARQLSQADGWKVRQTALERAAASGAASLSAEMKMQAMALYGESIALRRALDHQ